MPIAYRWGGSSSLAVTSGTAVLSTAVFGSQTRTIRVMTTAAAVSVLVTDAAVSSTAVDTTGMPLPLNVPEYFIVTPGQKLAAHSQSATSTAVWVTEGV